MLYSNSRFIYFTTKQLFLQGIHLGAQLTKSHTNMKRYLLNTNANISFSLINLKYSVIFFKIGFNLIHNVISKRGILLVVNECSLLQNTLKSYWKHLNQPISFGEWSSGTLSNFRFILKKTLKTYFVKSKLADKISKLSYDRRRLPLRLNNKIRSKFNLNIFLSELRRRIRKLYALPHVLFVTDTLLSAVVVRESNIVGIPLVGIVDSTNNILDVSYPIPGNSTSLKSLLFYYKIVKLVILKGMLTEKKLFLRNLRYKFNREIKAIELVNNKKTLSVSPNFSWIFPQTFDKILFSKDFNIFLINLHLFYFFYPNFSQNFYSKNKNVYSILKSCIFYNTLTFRENSTELFFTYFSRIIQKSKFLSDNCLGALNLNSTLKPLSFFKNLLLNYKSYYKDYKFISSKSALYMYLITHLLANLKNSLYISPMHVTLPTNITHSVYYNNFSYSNISLKNFSKLFSLTSLKSLKKYGKDFVLPFKSSLHTFNVYINNSIFNICLKRTSSFLANFSPISKDDSFFFSLLNSQTSTKSYTFTSFFKEYNTFLYLIAGNPTGLANRQQFGSTTVSVSPNNMLQHILKKKNLKLSDVLKSITYYENSFFFKFPTLLNSSFKKHLLYTNRYFLLNTFLPKTSMTFRGHNTFFKFDEMSSLKDNNHTNFINSSNVNVAKFLNKTLKVVSSNSFRDSSPLSKKIHRISLSVNLKKHPLSSNFYKLYGKII